MPHLFNSPASSLFPLSDFVLKAHFSNSKRLPGRGEAKQITSRAFFSRVRFYTSERAFQ